MGIDSEIFGLPIEYACTRLKCGWHCCSNNILIVSIRKVFERGKLSGLLIVQKGIEADLICQIISTQVLALAFDIGSTNL